MTTFAETGLTEHAPETADVKNLESATTLTETDLPVPTSVEVNIEISDSTPTFAETGLPERALAAVAKLGFGSPTPVQEQAIPYVLQGRDVIAAASTGTGKTAAFLLPTMGTLPRVKRGPRPPRILVVSPTRELAQQIAHTAMKVGRETNHFTTTVFGGTSYGPQINELRRGTDVLIATPGRLNDLIDKGVVDLSAIEVLVLDEADRMLDMGFLPDVSKIVSKTPETRQTLLFSATIDESIQSNLGSLLHDPAVVEVARNGETAKTVDQYLIPIKNFKKPELLRAVLEEKGHERVVVFARTKNRTEECAEALKEAGYKVESIHSDKSQGNRRHALANFRNGKANILVATDVLARGIDVPQVDYVVNFDLPDMAEDYVHRIGRTGRAGETGLAISFVTRENKHILREIEQLIDKNLPYMTLETYATDPAVLGRGAKGGASGGSRKSSAGGRSGKGSTAGKRKGEGAGKVGHSKSGKPGKDGKDFATKRKAAVAFENERSTRSHKGDFMTSDAQKTRKGGKRNAGQHNAPHSNKSAGHRKGQRFESAENRDRSFNKPQQASTGASTAKSNKQSLRDAARKRQSALQHAAKNGSHGGYDYSKFKK